MVVKPGLSDVQDERAELTRQHPGFSCRMIAMAVVVGLEDENWRRPMRFGFALMIGRMTRLNAGRVMARIAMETNWLVAFNER